MEVSQLISEGMMANHHFAAYTGLMDPDKDPMTINFIKHFGKAQEHIDSRIMVLILEEIAI